MEEHNSQYFVVSPFRKGPFHPIQNHFEYFFSVEFVFELFAIALGSECELGIFAAVVGEDFVRSCCDHPGT